jgi:uncharacterized surface protein with fasciclin (FAS1) repeats
MGRVNLMQQISSNPNLTSFNQYLVKSGYDKVLASSKQFTVFAPNNAAMTSVDPGILADTTRLKQFVGNHISYQLYTTSLAQPTIRVQMLNGKSETLSSTTIELATIVTADLYAQNGILQIINKAITPKLNIWDYVTNAGGKGLSTDGIKEQNYLLSQNYQVIDSANSKVIGVDPLTGKVILQPVFITNNHYKDNAADPANETNQYTFFVLADAGFDANTNAELKYFTTSSVDSTSKLTSFNILKDLIVPGVYSTKNEPGTLAMKDTIISIFGSKVPINMADTIRSYNASNGRVYVMKTINFRLQDKITPIFIEGESEPQSNQPGAWLARYDKAGDIYYRIKNDPTQPGKVFKDIFIEQNSNPTGGTLPPPFWCGYPIQSMYTVSYKVYIRAINDTRTVFNQRIDFGSINSNVFPYTPVTLNNYNEVYLGTYTPAKYGYNSMFLLGSLSTTGGQNSLTMDYIKLVPILP